MSWTLLSALVLILTLSVLWLWSRRVDLKDQAESVREREHAKAAGTHAARLQYPHVDLARCIGCGSCVAACPEDGVLGLVHGQAVVLHGARCVGHGRCAVECPVGAIALTLGDLENRRDIPALKENLESTLSPGLFLAGEVTGYALVSTAINHGIAVADEVAKRVHATPVSARSQARSYARPPSASNGGLAVLDLRVEERIFDLVVVGAGPAGIACSLQAKAKQLDFVTLEQDSIGGTVAKYPRRKLVMTQPVVLPLVGKLTKTSYSKEDLVELWMRVSRENRLPIRTGEEFVRVDRGNDGILRVHTKTSVYASRNVCLALGRRGTPRKLGIPGEDLNKVSYSLLDAHSYQHRRILVVGGGDSAIEAAIGLSEQPGNQVTLSYRKANFTRIKSRNEARLLETLHEGTLSVMYESEVLAIERDRVHLRTQDGRSHEFDNDEVFIFAGGTPPTDVLEASGISFDPADRPAPPQLIDQGTGLLSALFVALGLAVTALAWTAFHSDYYTLEPAARAAHESHRLLRPSGAVGLSAGIAGAAFILCNLCYLARRSGRFDWIPGSLQSWMTSHVVTGILALLCAIVHSAMAPHHTVGGHALLGLAILVVTGAIGRYFYAFVPRAANGRELALEEVRSRLASISGEWDRGSGSFGESVRTEVQRLMAEGHWQGSFFTRLEALLANESRLKAKLASLREQGRREGVAPSQIEALMSVARRAQRTALMAAHFEDLRALMASWRYFHRWVALGMVLVLAVHVYMALRYGEFFG